MPDIHYRPARKDDCPRLAELVDLAAGGTVDYLFHDLADDRSPVQILTSGLADDHSPHSFAHALVAEIGDTIAGMILAFPAWHHRITREMREFIPAERLDHFQDYFTARVPGSLFIDTLAVDPLFQRRGIASELLHRISERARTEGFSFLSLIVFADNTAARTLYTALGFTEVEAIPLDRHPLIPHDGGCLLLRCAV